MRYFKSIKWNMLPVIIALAWPTMFEQLMQTAVQYIDTAMVGSLGTSATAAVGSTTTINWLVNGSISALGIGFLSYIAQSLGASDKLLAKRASGQAVLATLTLGILFTSVTLLLAPYIPHWMQADSSIRQDAANYFFILYAPMLPRTATLIFGTVLRAAGDTKTPMRVGIIVNIINVVLNFVLIYPTKTYSFFSSSITLHGADMGIEGAALASAVAFTVGGVLITIALWKHPDISPKGMRILPDMNILRPCLKVAIPNMLQRFGTSLGYVVFASMINALGDVATAAHSIANTVESAFYIPGYGMQTAAATLAGNALGARDRERMRDFSKVTLIIEVALMIVTGGLLFAFAEPMMAIFSKDRAVVDLGAFVLRMVALSEPFYGVSIILEGMMLGVGYTMIPFIYNVIGMWGIRIVGTYICTTFLGMGLVSAWSCMILHNLLLFALFTTRYVQRKWNPLEL